MSENQELLRLPTSHLRKGQWQPLLCISYALKNSSLGFYDRLVFHDRENGELYLSHGPYISLRTKYYEQESSKSKIHIGRKKIFTESCIQRTLDTRRECPGIRVLAICGHSGCDPYHMVSQEPKLKWMKNRCKIFWKNPSPRVFLPPSSISIRKAQLTKLMYHGNFKSPKMLQRNIFFLVLCVLPSWWKKERGTHMGHGKDWACRLSVEVMGYHFISRGFPWCI